MTLLDASIIIEALQARDLQLLSAMRDSDGAICGVTRAEVLCGGRGQRDREHLTTILNGFRQVQIPEPLWDEVGTIQSSLRAAGLTIPLADSVLIALALSFDFEVWARDGHFSLAQSILPALKLR